MGLPWTNNRRRIEMLAERVKNLELMVFGVLDDKGRPYHAMTVYPLKDPETGEITEVPADGHWPARQGG